MNQDNLKPISDRLLKLFVSRKYHWNSLNPDQQMAMAVELVKHRFLQEQYLRFIDEVLNEKEGYRHYRELLNVDD